MKQIIPCALILILSALFLTGCVSGDLSRGIAGPASVDANEPGMQDTVFVNEALASSLYELEMGRLGVERAQNVDVRLLAQKIYDDQDRAYKQLRVIAHEEKIEVSESVLERGSVKAPALPSGAAFDNAYLDHLFETRYDSIKKFEAAARNARNTQVRDFAARTLPGLQEHLRMAANVGDLVAAGDVIAEPAGAERIRRDPFLQGDPVRRHQFDNR